MIANVGYFEYDHTNNDILTMQVLIDPRLDFSTYKESPYLRKTNSWTPLSSEA